MKVALEVALVLVVNVGGFAIALSSEVIVAIYVSGPLGF